jgi:hypothetical protein
MSSSDDRVGQAFFVGEKLFISHFPKAPEKSENMFDSISWMVHC